MTLFKAPDVTMRKTRNDAWLKKVGGKRLGGPRQLWGDYWRRFNTMQIPILGEDEYFKTATEIAEVAANEEEFENLFMKRNQQRQEELLDLTADITRAIAWDKCQFPCSAAKGAARKAGTTGCFEYFVSLLRGNVLGWEADEAGDDVPNNAIADSGEEPKKPDDKETQKPYGKEVQSFGDYIYKDYMYRGRMGHWGSPSPYSSMGRTQRWGDIDHFYAGEDLDAYAKSRRGLRQEQGYREQRATDIQEINSSDKEDMNHHENDRWLLNSPYNNASASHSFFPAHGIANGAAAVEKSRPANDSLIRKHRRSESPATAASPNASSIKQTTPGGSKKGVRFQDDDDDDDDEREHKRQRTQSPVPTLHVPSDTPSALGAAESSMKRRRSDSDEDDDEDDVDRGRKRQRRQSPAPAMPPASSSVQQSAVANPEKRSGISDGDDDDEDDQDEDGQRRKRQKM
ncbi:uncharacterized protein Triagg1_2290 [Trichoderma aggressivum f. europaeum]|uniref:Uncharacterized protein n=1 Tax=Trichoderma aggressivum f. europaeum TaxID=173218 RepID=A0AAE1IIX3_9HYPO|nr:hypothetical protein Triagg1_2290 [Trichoderma aggressivum f. europaeum]